MKVPDRMKGASQKELGLWKRRQEAEEWSVDDSHQAVKAAKHVYGPLQKGTANRDNFMWNTVAEFESVPKRPRRKPDYTSTDRNGKVSSEYWYEPDGVIRGSKHWGVGVASCDWAIEGVAGKGSEITMTNKLYGKAKWEDFTQKTRDVKTTDGKVIGETNFENTTEKNTVKIGGKEYEYNRLDHAWREIVGKSFDYIIETTKKVTP